jgi:hypothetical protein
MFSVVTRITILTFPEGGRSLIDPWRNGATARPVYETIAEHTFSLNSAESFSDLWLHVRGSKAYGGVEIVGLGTEVTEHRRVAL